MPTLPLELILEILESAALSDASNVPALLVVCRAVHDIVLPIAQNARVLRTMDDVLAFERTVARCSPPLVARRVHALALMFLPSEANVLSRLPIVQHLGVVSTQGIPESYARNLRSLDVLDDNEWQHPLRPLEISVFTRLERLRMGRLLPQLSAPLFDDGALPALTHLAFVAFTPSANAHLHAHARYACVRILETRPALKLLVACGYETPLVRRTVATHLPILDERFVVLLESVYDTEESRLQLWVDRARGLSGGIWELAEQRAARQRMFRALTNYTSLTAP